MTTSAIPAVRSRSLAALRWLAEEQYCSLAGAHALSFGRPRKAVLRIAIEHAAVDVMQARRARPHARARPG